MLNKTGAFALALALAAAPVSSLLAAGGAGAGGAGAGGAGAGGAGYGSRTSAERFARRQPARIG